MVVPVTVEQLHRHAALFCELVLFQAPCLRQLFDSQSCHLAVSILEMLGEEPLHVYRITRIIIFVNMIRKKVLCGDRRAKSLMCVAAQRGAEASREKSCPSSRQPCTEMPGGEHN